MPDPLTPEEILAHPYRTTEELRQFFGRHGRSARQVSQRITSLIKQKKLASIAYGGHTYVVEPDKTQEFLFDTLNVKEGTYDVVVPKAFDVPWLSIVRVTLHNISHPRDHVFVAANNGQPCKITLDYADTEPLVFGMDMWNLKTMDRQLRYPYHAYKEWTVPVGKDGVCLHLYCLERNGTVGGNPMPLKEICIEPYSS